VTIGTGRHDLHGREKLSKGRMRWFIIEVEVKNVAEAVAQGVAMRTTSASTALAP
jgi:hypothetical protein